MTPKHLTATAAELACAVADEDHHRASQILDSLCRQELSDLAALLAAHVDIDQPFTTQPEQHDHWQDKVIDRVALEVARRYRIPTSRLSDRDPATRDARFVAWYAAHRLLGVSSKRLGRVYGFDHTTVLNGCRRVDSTPRLQAVAFAVAASCGWQRAAGVDMDVVAS